MKVIVADHAGTCYGVQRALDIVSQVAESGKQAQTLGPLIHNPRVVKQFENKGISVAHKVSDITAKTVILRSHGVLPNVRDELSAKELDVKDATCPYVLRAQKAAQALAESHEALVVVGDSGHPEVEGLIAYGKLGNDHVHVLSCCDDIPFDLPNDLGVVVQTTQNEKILGEIVSQLENMGKRLEVKNTICGATHVRQEAALEMSRAVDVVIVIGGKNSSNTTRLFKICSQECARSHHIEQVSEIDPHWFAGSDKVGVAAGASTPNEQIEEVVRVLTDIAKDKSDN